MTGDRLGDDYKGSFHRAADAANEAFAIPGAMDRIVKMPFGEMPAGMAVDIAIFDVTTHAWDLAKATGQSTDLDPEVAGIAYLVAQNMLNDDLRSPGLFGPAVEVAPDAARRRPPGCARRPHAVADQAGSASVSDAHGRPSASATAGFTTCPSAVFTPAANSGSFATASRTPRGRERDHVRAAWRW